MSDAASKSTPGFRFSTATLLLLVVIASLGLGLFYSWRANEQTKAAAQREIGALQEELNYLSVSDPTRLQGKWIYPARPRQTRKWRVYLPPEHKWDMWIAIGQIPERGHDIDRTGRDNELFVTSLRLRPEMLLPQGVPFEVELCKDFGFAGGRENENWSWRIVVDSDALPGRGFSFPVVENMNAMLNGEVAMLRQCRSGEFRSWSLTMPPDKPYDLCRHRWLPVGASGADAKLPQPGYVIWFEAAKE